MKTCKLEDCDNPVYGTKRREFCSVRCGNIYRGRKFRAKHKKKAMESSDTGLGNTQADEYGTNREPAEKERDFSVQLINPMADMPVPKDPERDRKSVV